MISSEETVRPECIDNVKGCDKIKACHICEDEKYGEERAEPALFQNCLDIVSRTSVAGAVLRLFSYRSVPAVLSIKADALPRSAVTHIQNTAPGPPRQIAVEMPAIFPGADA